MASDLIGRTKCPECGFAAAHVKQKAEKEGAKPYRFCPSCGAQYFTRSNEQARALLDKLNEPKQEEIAHVVPIKEPEPEKPEKPKQKMVFGVMVPA